MNRQSVFFSFSGFQCKLQFAAQQLRKAIEQRFPTSNRPQADY